MIAYDSNAPITRYGRTFKAWTKRQLIEMTARLPLTKAERALVSYPDMLRYVGSMDGMDHALAIACGGKEADMESMASITQKAQLIGDLVDILIGAYANTDQVQEGDGSDAPFVETEPTGHSLTTD